MKRSAAEMTTATLTADWLAYAEVCIRSASAAHPLRIRSDPALLPLYAWFTPAPCTLYVYDAHPHPERHPSHLHGSNMRCRRTVQALLTLCVPRSTAATV